MSNADWLTRTQAALWHPCTQMKHLERMPPLPIARGEGPWLVDFDGRRYLDCISSWWVNLFGHANPRINAAITDQLGRIEHAMLAGCTHAPVVALSERLGKLAGLGHVFYGSDGASAIEIALKMSFHFWRNVGQTGKTGFVSLRDGYHGETLGALSVTDVALFKDTYAPLLHPSHQVMSPDWRRAEPEESAEAYALRAAASLEDFLAECADTTAAVILEPLVQGAAGMALYDPEYLRLARTLCDRFEVHLICDEIAVGFGRTGTFFAHEQGDIQPDLLCLSKGLSGGTLPLSVVLSSDAIYGAFLDDSLARGFLHSHSYTGNPLACRAALATLDIFAADDVLAANRRRAAQLGTAFAPLANHGQVRHLRQRGMILAFDVDAPDPAFSRRFYRAALAREALVRPIGKTLYVMPPYVVGEAEIAHLAGAIAGALAEALAA